MPIRIIAVAVPILWASSSMSQVEWGITLPFNVESAQVRDAQMLDSGECLAVVTSHHQNDTTLYTSARTWLVSISPEGMVDSTREVFIPGRYVQGSRLVRGGSFHPYTLFANTWDSTTQAGRSIGQFRMDQAGHMLGSTEHLFQNGTYQCFFADAALDADSAWFITGDAKIGPGIGFSNKVFLMRLTQDGSMLGQQVLGNSNGFTLSYHVVQVDSLMMVSVFAGPVGPMGVTKFLRFNNNLDFVNGFAARPISGGSNVLLADSIIHDGLSMTVLPSRSTIVSGRIGNIHWMNFAAMRVDEFGQLQAVFAPEPEVLFEFCGIFQSQDVEPDGTIVTAVVQNINIYNPQMSTIPSRIHIYQLDTMLNVLCDQVAVDGAADGSYYMLNRVKATPDGGTLFMGSKMNVNTQSLPQPWIMKIAPWDCQRGIREQEVATAASVWPNPGNTGFTAFVNGPVVARGTLDLYNAQGQLATSTDVMQSSATMSTTNLAPGVYLYRITDSQGTLRATGRWVKE